MHRLVVLPAFLAWFFVCSAYAQESAPERFSDRGRMMASGDLGGRWTNDSFAERVAAQPTWTVYGRPSFTYFLRNHIGLGILVGGSVTRAAVPASETYGSVKLRDREFLVGAHALLELPLGELLGVLLRPSLSYVRSERVVLDCSSRQDGESSLIDHDGIGASYELRAIRSHLEFESNYVRGALFVHLVVTLSPNVVIGLGPDVWLDVFITQEPKVLRSEYPGGGRPLLPHDPARTRVFLGATTWIGASF